MHPDYLIPASKLLITIQKYPLRKIANLGEITAIKSKRI